MVINSIFFYSISYYSFNIYVCFFAATVFYVLPLVGGTFQNASYKAKNSSIIGRDLVLFCGFIFLCLFANHITRYSEITSSCFGHLISTAQTLKLNLLLLLVFFFFLVCVLELSVFSTRSTFDFVAITVTFLLWFLFLFTLTTLFAVIFLFELLSILVLLLLVSSAFTPFRVSIESINRKPCNQFSQCLDGFLHFFWISLVASILLFVSVIYFKFYFFSFEWTFLELSFSYAVNGLVASHFLVQNCLWVGFLMAVFVKTGLAPFFVWKTVLFKNSSFVTIFFYTVVYYYFFIMFLFIFFSTHLPTFTAYFVFSYMVLFSIGFITLFFILCETTYIKVFLALSSVFNSLFAFCVLTCTDHAATMFFL